MRSRSIIRYIMIQNRLTEKTLYQICFMQHTLFDINIGGQNSVMTIKLDFLDLKRKNLSQKENVSFIQEKERKAISTKPLFASCDYSR